MSTVWGPGTVLATTSQQKIGIALAVMLVVGWAVYIFVHLRTRRQDAPPGSEYELAPNRRPYYEDDELEGRILERSLTIAVALLVVVAIGLPWYWAREPARAKGATRGFDNRAAQRGFLMFQPADSPLPSHNIGHFGCATCHGAKGEGGAASFVVTDALGNNKKVQWKAPALNTVLLRYTPDTVRTILIYGRANTPMPAWGVAGGGAMNDQQIDDLVAYLKSIQLSPEAAKQQQANDYSAEMKAEGKSTVDAQVLFNVNCARCHTKGWSIGEPEVPGAGAYGPNLTNGDALRQFPDPSTQIDFVTKGADFGKAYGVRGIGNQAPAVRSGADPGLAMQGGGMPYFGTLLSDAEIAAIVDYERGL
jgi:mono/diheme cytochrome c family protein